VLCLPGDRPPENLGWTIRFHDGDLDNPLVRIRLRRWLRVLSSFRRPGCDGDVLVDRLEGVQDAVAATRGTLLSALPQDLEAA